MIESSYLRVARDIREKIAAGELKPGAKLPSTAELKELYGVGNTAIRNAMLVLRMEGLIEGHQGKGVYVK